MLGLRKVPSRCPIGLKICEKNVIGMNNHPTNFQRDRSSRKKVTASERDLARRRLWKVSHAIF